MAKDPETRAHRAWLGLLQPVGLVVSPPALVEAQAVVARNPAGLQKRLRGLLEPDPKGRLRLNDFARLTRKLLRWEPEDLVPGDALEDTLEVALPEHQEVLRPSYAVPDPDHEGNGRWLMLVQQWPAGTDLDAPPPREQRGWRASPQIRLERLLRDTAVPLGLLCTPAAIRMVVAPVGESSGHLTFPVEAMAEVGGRPILAALHMLLCAERVFTLPPARRLSAILAESRKVQNVVSTKLAEQVLRALGELLRGFQAADEARDGRLLGDVVREDPQRVYGGLVTVLMRLVFLLYAEEREMLPDDPVYVGHYSVGGLFEKLRADAGMYPDTMDQRYGAWARLLSLSRLVYDGGGHGGMRLPTRHGQLFAPDEYPFLEGRDRGPAQMGGGGGEPLDPPRVSDGVVHRVLEDLLMLDGERLSYRSLDVEQIGSVYEAVMGFEVERATGASIGVRPQHVVVDLDGVLNEKGKARVDALEKGAGCKLGKAASKQLEAAKTVDDVVAALGKKVSPQTPRVLPPGSLYLQPTEERRRSGSHYTPRSLTEPIVRTTLRPVLEGLGPRPTAEQILGLKVCDPAMGSGAFLVEACRHLAQTVVDAWDVHGDAPQIPATEDPRRYARRLVAQRCLYGVDKNPFAVNLARLSLWLVTLAKDHAFTFLDHALKCGDSLVGLTRRQIAAFHWEVPEEASEDLPLFRWMNAQVEKASAAREQIARLGDGEEADKQSRLAEAEQALEQARRRGDAIVRIFWSEDTKNKRSKQLSALRPAALERRAEPMPTTTSTSPEPFHWELEFSEIFDRTNPGLDCFIGNPPFMGGNKIPTSHGPSYFDWITTQIPQSGGICDLSAYFLRRAFSLLRSGGTLGLIATKTIAKGKTREAGLGFIRQHGGQIYCATKRKSWPGQAAVITSIVHVIKAEAPRPGAVLNGRPTREITSYLFHLGGDLPPAPLSDRAPLFSQGTNPRGKGFLFDDDDPACTPTSVMQSIIARSPREAERIRPYIGGEEINQDPQQRYHRYIITTDDIATKAELRKFPSLYEIIERKVLPERLALGSNPNNTKLKRRWWSFHAARHDFYARITRLTRVLVNTQVSNNVAFVFQPSDRVFSLTLNIYALDRGADFAVLQSRPHEIWARFFGSTMKDDLRYTPSTCFATFAFPSERAGRPGRLNEEGESYHRYRADLMVRNNEGLTATYNRFHDPEETSPEILALRDLHDQVDRAVLDAYGWTDIQPTCEFLLDYEEDEVEASSSRRRKPWRYRWPDEIQQEVLARLLDLNQERAETSKRQTSLPLGDGSD